MGNILEALLVLSRLSLGYISVKVMSEDPRRIPGRWQADDSYPSDACQDMRQMARYLNSL